MHAHIKHEIFILIGNIGRFMLLWCYGTFNVDMLDILDVLYIFVFFGPYDNDIPNIPSIHALSDLMTYI